MDQILEQMHLNADLAYNVVCLRSLKDSTFFHSVNTCIYALIAATGLALPPEDQRDLGIGAMLHDIGKIYYLDLVNKPDPLTEEEEKRLRRHPVDGFELLRRQPNVNLLAAHVAYQHHEQFDGSGYPRGLRSDQIHVWAQATTVADIYDTITADRSYGKGLAPHAAMAVVKELAETGKVAPAFVRQLMLRVAAYPEGTILQLASGEIAVVVAQTAKGGTRPRARVVTDARLRLCSPGDRVIDGREPETAVSQVLADCPRRVRRQMRLPAV